MIKENAPNPKLFQKKAGKAIVVPIKHEYDRDTPLATCPSFLVTFEIMLFIGRDQAFDFLQYASHNCRAYANKQRSFLNKTQLDTCIPDLKTNRATAMILKMYGEHNRVLQTMQVVSKKSRGFCKQENGFKGTI